MASFCPVRLSFRNDYLPNNDELPPIQYPSPEILNLLKQTIPRFNFFGSIEKRTLLDLIIGNNQNNNNNQVLQDDENNNNNSTDYLVGILSIWIVVTAILCFWCLLLVTCRYNQRFQKTLFSGKRPITNPPPVNIDTRRTTISSSNNYNNKTDVVADEENWKQRRKNSRQSIQEKELEEEEKEEEQTTSRSSSPFPSSQDLQDRNSSSIVMDMEDYENDDNNDIADADDIRNRAFLQDEDDEEEEEEEEEKVDENDDAPPPPLPQQEVLIVSQPQSSSPPKSPSRNGQQSNNTSPPKSPKIAPSPKDTPLIHPPPPPPDSTSTTLSSSAPQIPLQNQNDDNNNDENVAAVTTKKSYVTSTKYDEYIRYLKDAATSRPNLKILLSRSNSGDGSSGGYIGSSDNTDSSEDDDVLLEQCLSDPENFIKQSLSLTLPPTPSSLTQTPSSMGGYDDQDQEDKETTTDTNNINDTTSIFNSLNTTDTSFPDQGINLSLMNPSTVRLPTTSSGSGNDDDDDDDPINGSGFLLFQDDDCDTSGEQQQQYNREGEEEENSLLFANRSQAIISRNISSGSSSKMTMMHQPRHHQPVYTSSSFSSPPSISNSTDLVAASLPHSNYSSHAASRKRLLEDYVESFRSSSALSVDEQQQQRLQPQEPYNNNNISIHSKSLGSSAVVVDYSQIHPTLPDSTRSMIVANAAETSRTNIATAGSAFTPTGSSKGLNNDNMDHTNNNTNNLTFQYDLTNNTNTMDTLQYYDLSAYERDQAHEEEEEEKKQDGQQQHHHNYSIQKHQMHDEAEAPEQRPFSPPNYQYNLSQKRGIDDDDDDDYGDKNSENDDKEVRSNLSPRALSLGGGGGSNNNTPRPSASKLNKKYTSSRELAKAWKEWSKQENRYDCHLQIFRIAVVLLSTLLIVSALLFTLNGVLNLNEQTSSIQQSWEEDIQDKATQLDDSLQTLQQLQNSVLQQTWNIWQLLDQSCPFVVATRGEPSTNTTAGAGGGDADGGVCSSNYSCNVAGLPLEDEWNDWLQFSGQENVANLYQGENWTSLQIDLDRLIFFDDDKQNGNIETDSEEGFFQRLTNNSSPAMYFSWSLWTTCACNSFLALLALIIMAGTSFNINCLDTRWFGVLFWLFVFLAWVFATIFWIGLFVTADACTGGGDDDDASGTDHQDNSYPNAVVSALLENRVQPNSILAKYWEYYIDGCHAEDYPSAVNNRVWLWANLLPPTQRLANGLESLDSIEFVQTCGTVVDPLTDAASVLSLQLCMVTQAMVNIRRLLACDQWYPSYESIVYDAVCFHGSQGLVWGAAAQITILLSAFMIWTLRAAFLPMREILDDDVERDEKYDDDGDKLSKKQKKNGIGLLKAGCCCCCCPTRSEDEQGGEFPTPQETA